MFVSGTAVGCGMTVCIALWTAEAHATDPAAGQVYRFEGGTVTITPGPVATRPFPAAVAAPVSDPPPLVQPVSHEVVIPSSDAPVVTAGHCSGMTLAEQYRSVYEAIPFNRAEYDANPSYRHETTMELLFGQLRPMVIQRSNINVDVQGIGGGDSYLDNGYRMTNPWFYPFNAPGYRVYRGR